jgi:Rod binding domain-containing protein
MSDVPSVEDTIAAFDRFYTDVQYRDKIAQAGFSLTQQPKYKWQNVAQQFDAVFQQLMKDFDYGK